MTTGSERVRGQIHSYIVDRDNFQVGWRIMVEIRTPVDGQVSHLSRLKAQFPRVLTSIFRRTTVKAYKEAPNFVPQDSGATLASLRIWFTDEGLEISFRSSALPFADEGALPHMIVPKTPEGYLRFRDSSGDLIFRKRVVHPGYEPTNFIEKFASRVAEILSEEIDLAIITLGVMAA